MNGALYIYSNGVRIVRRHSKVNCFILSQVKARNMNIYCECAGDHITTISKQSFVDKLKTFRNVAK